MEHATDPVDQFVARVRDSLAQQQFVKLALGRPRAASAELQRVFARRLVLRGEAQLSFVERHASKDLTRNLPLAEGLVRIAALLRDEFDHGHLLTTAHDIQLSTTRKGQRRLRVGKLAAPPAASQEAAAHDREKHRHIALDRPFLAALGVTDAQQRVLPSMARKWKQINKFVEVLEHAFDSSPLAPAAALGRALQVLDFGSGKGYLTFAMHDWLRHTRGLDVQVTGVELREDMVALGNGVVRTLGLQGLHFEQGDVRERAPQPIDIMVALHACDIATDHAMHAGIRAGAAIIVCSPCCHKQLRPQMLCPRPLGPMLDFGVHLGQQAEMLTDSLRALLLESQGYAAQVFEFVSLEHTSKNKMILAVKRTLPVDAAERLAQVREIKDFYGIREQCLEALLAEAR